MNHYFNEWRKVKNNCFFFTTSIINFSMFNSCYLIDTWLSDWLIMTFGDVNDNKNKNEKMNNKNNDIISQLNNVIINDESLNQILIYIKN